MEEVVATAVEVALAISDVEQVAPVDVRIVVHIGALHGEDGLAGIVELDLRHVAVVVVEGVLSAVDHSLGIGGHVVPVALVGANTCQHGSSTKFVHTAYRSLTIGKNRISLLEVVEDEAYHLGAGIAVVADFAGVLVLGEIGEALEDTIEVEVVVGTEELEFADILHRTHGDVDTRDGVIVVLPLEEAGGVGGRDAGDLEQVDVVLHRSAATALEGIVGAYVEDPVGGWARESLVVADEVSLQTCVSCCHQTIDGILVHLLIGELTVGISLEHIIAAGHEKGGTAEETCSKNIIEFHI